ncbi:TonB-dependent receptor plug domain-containing protein [Novilysobacter spongiicola]|uniref:Iron complex outermembrane recepter protein n=1 Tax=Lysobacter spongiicola DSM 21749 TaxID=1122188 RepID=A0A1T4RE09_9GAMM|nr:TonB-dependent receptor [Lysobacter spongiicola]SKA13978.1 iron complex outermembrane recepter protein [Lysobacter spongiicola DSM 21749]
MTLKTTKLRDAIGFAIAMSATGFIGMGSALAQDTGDSQSEEATTLDRVEVTGSRLTRATVEGALPVVVIDRQEIEASGEASVADYLRTTNFSSTGQFRPQSGSSAQAGAFADLRGLGSNRTLVLIDGHRAPKAPFSASSQDLNVIPMAAVERIEVLTDGASAIYGADAVGGVINIITRKDYNGASIMVGKSIPEWGATDEAAAIVGISGDRGNTVAGFSHNRREMIYTRDRPWGAQLGSSIYGNNYVAVDPDTGAALRDPSRDDDVYWPVPGGCENTNFYIQEGTGRCVYDFNRVAADEASYNNKSFFSNSTFDINDDWSMYLRTCVANTKSFGRYAPTPGVVVLDPDSASNPAPGNITYLYHRFAAAGNRDNNTNANVYDINLGFDGRLSDNADLRAGVRYNTYDYNEFGQNYIVQSLAEQAINDGLYDIYDPASTPEDVLNSIKATITRQSEFTTKEAYFNLTMYDLFQMGGGGSGIAVGGEFRKEDFADIYDSLSAAGVVLGSSGASAGDSREVSALYGEWQLPITSTFEVNLAGRWEDYSDYGSNFAPKASFRWQPLENLTLRGSVGQGFVAPTLDIISQATAFSADTVYDPATCLAFQDYTAAQVAEYGSAEAYCNAEGGNLGVQRDAFREKAEGLGAEESDQYQFGVVWDATDWLNVSVDYWNIEISDRIAYYSSQKLINIDIGDDPTPMPGAPCSIQRNPDLGNAISEIHNCYFNEGEVETDGIDLSLRTNFDMGGWGELNNELRASFQNSYTIDGGEEQVGLQGFPELRATMNNRLVAGDFTYGYNIRFIGDNGEDGSATGSYTTHDVYVQAALPWNANVTLGVNNVGDKMPQMISYDGRPFNFYLYDAYGSSPYFRYEQNF